MRNDNTNLAKCRQGDHPGIFVSGHSGFTSSHSSTETNLTWFPETSQEPKTPIFWGGLVQPKWNQGPRKTMCHQILGTCSCEPLAAQSKCKDGSSTLGSHLHRPNSKLDSSSNSIALQNNLCCSYICQNVSIV